MFATPLVDIIRPELRHSPAQLKIIIAQLTFEVVARGGLIQFQRNSETGDQSLVRLIPTALGNERRILWSVSAEPNDMQLLGCATQLYSIVTELSKDDLKVRWNRLASRLSVEELDLLREAAKEGYL